MCLECYLVSNTVTGVRRELLENRGERSERAIVLGENDFFFFISFPLEIAWKLCRRCFLRASHFCLFFFFSLSFAVILRAGKFRRRYTGGISSPFSPLVSAHTRWKRTVEKREKFSRVFFGKKRPTDFYRSSRCSETMYIYIYIGECVTDTSASATVAYTGSIAPFFRESSPRSDATGTFNETSIVNSETTKNRLEKRGGAQAGTETDLVMADDDLPTMIKQLTSIIRILAVLSWAVFFRGTWRKRLGGVLGRRSWIVTAVSGPRSRWYVVWWSRRRTGRSRSQVASVPPPPVVVGGTRGVARDDEAARISDDGEPRNCSRSSSSVTRRSVSWSTTSLVVQPTAKVHAVAVQGHTWRADQSSGGVNRQRLEEWRRGDRDRCR